jgi:uncharacterized protein (TIGR00369 family)
MQLSAETSWLGGFAEAVGFTMPEASGDRVVVQWDVTEAHHQPYGIVHGGVYCAAVEAAASIAGALWFGDRGKVVGVNNNTDFLRAIGTGTVYGTATPVHRGRRQQLWLVTIANAEDRLVARGQVRLQNLEAESG